MIEAVKEEVSKQPHASAYTVADKVRKRFEDMTTGQGVVHLAHVKVLENQVYNFKKVTFGDAEAKLYMNPTNITACGRTFIQFGLI